MSIPEITDDWQQVLSILELRVSSDTMNSVFRQATGTLSEEVLTVSAPRMALEWLQGRWYNHLASAARDALGRGVEVVCELQETPPTNGHVELMAESIQEQGIEEPVTITNWFKMPNQIVDMLPTMREAEMKVVIYTIRHTWGYQEYDLPKRISTDEFMNGRKRSDGTRMDTGTGLSNRAVINGLRRAVNHGYLVAEIDESDKARIEKSYVLNVKNSDVNKVHSQSI